MAQYQEGEWQNGLCSGVCGGDCNTCLSAWCCSCFLFGKLAHRLSAFPSEPKYELIDTNCAVMYAAGCCGANGLVAMMKRMEMREKFNIRGNGATDCLTACYCFPCVLAQMNTEVKGRGAVARNNAGAAQGYTVQQSGMKYEAPIQEQGVARAPDTQQPIPQPDTAYQQPKE